MLEEGDLVLVHNTPLSKSHSDKLGFRWLGPFPIREALGNGSYKVEELDGMAFRYPVHGNRINIYYKPLPLPDETLSARSTTSVSEDEGEPTGHRDDNDDWTLQDLIPEGETFAVIPPYIVRWSSTDTVVPWLGQSCSHSQATMRLLLKE